MPTTDEQWVAVRESVRTTTERFCQLVSSRPDPRATVTKKWSLADATAHVVTVAVLSTMLLLVAEVPFDMPGLAEAIAVTRVEDVHGLNDQVLGHFTERGTDRLVAMLRELVSLMLTESGHRDPAETFSWLGGAKLPLAGMFAHLVNELLIHGHDIARAVRVPWAMPPQDAALFFDLFYLALASGDPGRLLADSRRPVQRRIAVEFRSSYTDPVTLVVRDGKLTLERAGQDVDATVRFDPATLNMMMFGRISRARAVLTGKIVIGGRRAWLMPAFLRTSAYRRDASRAHDAASLRGPRSSLKYAAAALLPLMT